MTDIFRVGTSAVGARAKAVIAWNQATQEVRSGQVDAADGFEHWLIKFDGVRGNRDKELEDPVGYGSIEYAYSRMATAAGIEMSECRIMKEGGRRHFLTKRFDRQGHGKKLHMQSLGAIAHLDYGAAGAHSYEEAFAVIRELDLGPAVIEQQFRRMLFNVVARNQGDHVKNIAFLMDKSGAWSLSPAFDVTYSYKPCGQVDGRASDVNQRKTRRFLSGGLPSLREDGAHETRSIGFNTRRSHGRRLRVGRLRPGGRG